MKCKQCTLTMKSKYPVPSRPQRLTPSIQMSDSDGVNLTVTWDPTAESVSYQVIVAPASRSGQSVFVTILTSLGLTLEYSINYTVQVVAYTTVLETAVQLR